MLKLRAEQLVVLGRSDRERFVEQAIGDLRAGYPEEAARLGEQGLDELVRLHMERAFTYGIETERAMTGWLELTMELGPAFEDTDEHAWTRRILRDPDLPGDAKVSYLERKIFP